MRAAPASSTLRTVFSLAFLLCYWAAQDVNGLPWWQASSHMGFSGTRLPLIVTRDPITSRSTASLSSATTPTPGGGSSRTPQEIAKMTPLAAHKTDQVLLGGTKKKEDEEICPSRDIAKKLKNRNHVNFSRKVTHAAFGIFFAALNHMLPREQFLPWMTVVTGGTLLMELLRYRKGFGWMNSTLHFFLGSALRKHEMEGKFTGSFYYFLGVTASSYFFPKNAATMGIIQLALADPSASYFGRQTRDVYWSRIENGLGGFGRNKGILGFLGGALFCFPFNYRIFSLAKFGAGGIPGGRVSLAGVSLALGMAGALADLAVPTPALTMPKKVLGVRVPPLHVDDNFVVPLFSAYCYTKILPMFGWAFEVPLSTYIIF